MLVDAGQRNLLGQVRQPKPDPGSKCKQSREETIMFTCLLIFKERVFLQFSTDSHIL